MKKLALLSAVAVVAFAASANSNEYRGGTSDYLRGQQGGYVNFNPNNPFVRNDRAHNNEHKENKEYKKKAKKKQKKAKENNVNAATPAAPAAPATPASPTVDPAAPAQPATPAKTN